VSDPLLVALALGAGFAAILLGFMALLKAKVKVPAWVILAYQAIIIVGGLTFTFVLFRQDDTQKWMFAFLVGVWMLGAARYHLNERKARQDAARTTDTVGTGTTA
jgi:hypothetical protein